MTDAKFQKTEIIDAMRKTILENPGKALGATIEPAGRAWFVDETIRALEERGNAAGGSSSGRVDRLAVECAVTCELDAMATLSREVTKIAAATKNMQRVEKLPVDVMIAHCINTVIYEAIFFAIVATIFLGLTTLSLWFVEKSHELTLLNLFHGIERDENRRTPPERTDVPGVEKINFGPTSTKSTNEKL